MLVGKFSGVGISLVILALIGKAAVGFGQTVPTRQPPRETVAKLIAQLGDAAFRSRQQASDQLEKFGGPVLPALRKAATVTIDLEVRRRIELVVTRIENALFKAEEKLWQNMDAPRRGIKDRLVKILARTPALSDRQLASAVYLLTVGLRRTDEEIKRARKQFAQSNGRLTGILQLTRSLVQGKKFRAEIAAANVRLLKLQMELAAERGLAKRLALLNDNRFSTIAGEIAAALNKAVKTDEHIVDLAFLLVLSRFPEADNSKRAVAHLRKSRDRPAAIADIFWALLNSKEFLEAP